MWNFDLAKTKAGQELYSMGEGNGVKIGERRGERRGEKRSILEEIDRIQALKSKGAMADSLYKELIEPLKTKLAMLESVVMQDLEHEETGASAVS